MREAVGIDLDGTLLDSSKRHQMVLFDVLKINGIDILSNELDDFIEYKREGNSTRQYLMYKCFKGADKLANQWEQEIENSKYLKFDSVYSNIYELLNVISNNYSIYLISARSNHIGLLEQINKLNLVDFFDEIYVVEPGNGAALGKARISKDKNIMYVIGDTEVDFKWASLVNAKFIPVNYGFRSKNWWINLYNLESFSEVIDIIRIFIEKI